jgi:phosphoglucosamine mutase
MTRKYFGTDGIRGRVGQFPITPDFVLKLGYSAGKVLSRADIMPPHRSRPTVLIGKDTRISGYMLEAALESGLSAAGVDTVLVGPMPTPAVAFLTKALRLSAGVMISASHNPFEDNGIKFFSADGMKLPDAVETEIETMLDGPLEVEPSAHLGKAERGHDSEGRYLEFCKASFPKNLSLRDLKLVVDCANGANYRVGVRVFQELGAEVVATASKPNGLNINEGCGATHPQALGKAVVENKADFGIAFDGDGDRLGLVTKDGEIIFADRQLMLLAKDVLSRNPGAQIIYDVKSTRLLAPWIEKHGGRPLIWKTGHSFIKAKLKETGAPLAGEMSGHTFFKERWYGFDDALYGGARLLEVLAKEKDFNKTLRDLPNAPSTPELHWALAEGEPHALVAKLQARVENASPFPSAQRILTIDGVRVEYADGFGLARASNTTPVIVLRFEADTPAALERIKKDFRAALQPLKPNAPLPY